MATPASPTNLGFDTQKKDPEVQPPKNDPISIEQLSKCDGTDPNQPTYVAIKGSVFDVSGSPNYGPGGPYHVFAGKDASRALALSSTKPDDVRPEYEDLSDKAKSVLEEWFTYFSKRYNIVGKLQS